ncbi:hypothetical protein NEUTE1DRAFT_141053 [Neurospora tetrasperma FGSC 2508]|uniref:CBM1 domain-containing protein n=1 Tax=Neurospora tetrasperma (strain FGSC 2508 / ATCC MYA-4615 / P0657) TaxID=510951 RepID=F8MVM0_NEUT8|nr:uncharacterized protein NEUTE1DRAFT_141053 [Neurospora tetrasperma FGSC 2508]EGO54771.1 hypothetical protein NEUTE1DRAFT_141053 [Neurospora tetrasperma FGSC 2508]EGZ67747.1 hypothetical protein NEUTE2DRAFT_73238 [Neurospora tetrasperma FGSC 2509]
MRALPTLTSAKRALLPALLASIALVLPQTSTHLPPSLIHSSLPTLDSKAQVKNDQREYISTATIFSTIIVPTATELTTILTVITNAPAPSLSASTTTSSLGTSISSTSNCIVEGGANRICITVVPIWPTNTLAQAQAVEVKRQAQTQTPSISYSSTAVTVIEMLTVIVAPHTTYTLTGFVPFLTTSTSSAPIPTTTTTTTATSGITTSTSVTCPSPSWLIDGHCVYNTPGWNPAPQIPTGTDDWAGRPRPPWETGTRAV